MGLFILNTAVKNKKDEREGFDMANGKKKMSLAGLILMIFT